jgi:enoyl-CoA hydratase
MSGVRVEHDGAVTMVTIDRPEVRNAVDRPTAESLAAAFRAFDADPERSVAVLTGAGGVFCAGADLHAIAGGGERVNRLTADGDAPLGLARLRLGKPVIAAVEGHAVAGGLELALWCDLRVASETAVFGVFCRRWGVPLIDGGTVRLPRIVGQGRALDMILTGRPVDAAEAHAWGSPTAGYRRGRRSPPPSTSAASSPPCPSGACAPTASAQSSSGRSTSATRSTTSSATASRWCDPARRVTARSASAAVRDVTVVRRRDRPWADTAPRCPRVTCVCLN